MLIQLSEYLKPTKSLSRPHDGIVVDNVDPKKLGRVKCAIAGLLEGDKENLPWVQFLGKSSDSDVPDLGARLYIVFPFNSIYFPVALGYWHNTANHGTAFDANYPKSVGINRNGFILRHNKETNLSEIVHPSGSILKMLNDGTLEFTLAKDLKITATKMEVTATDDVKFTTDGKIELKTTSDAEISSTGNMKIFGTGGTEIGKSSSITKINGSQILLAGGGTPIAVVTSTCVGLGNLSIPVVSTIIDGSGKVFASR